MKLYDLKQYQSFGNGKARLVQTNLWAKPYTICRWMMKKMMAEKQIPGTFFKIEVN